jgi:hypothetical protein
MIGFIVPYTHTRLGATGNTALSLLHTLQFTVTHTLAFSVSTGHNRLTVTSNHTWSILYTVQFPFLPLFWDCQIRSLWSIQFLYYQAHILAGWRVETRLDSTRLDSTRLDSTTVLYSYYSFYYFMASSNCVRVWSQGKHSLYCLRGMFTAPLPSNRRHIVPHFCFCGNVFSESLHSNEHTYHNIVKFI